MTLQSMARALGTHWFWTIAGLMVSIAVAGVTFNEVPPTYSSSGIGVLVQPRQQAGRVANPLLNFDPSLSTNAVILIQTLNSPIVQNQVALTARSTYDVKNVGNSATGDPGMQPLLYFTTQANDPGESAAMVDRLMSLAGQELVDRQHDLRARPNTYIRFDRVVDPTAPKYVVGSQVAASGAALLAGLLATAGLIIFGERSRQRRAERVREKAPTTARPAREGAAVNGFRPAVALVNSLPELNESPGDRN